jgi:hypothetical protein
LGRLKYCTIILEVGLDKRPGHVVSVRCAGSTGTGSALHACGERERERESERERERDEQPGSVE